MVAERSNALNGRAGLVTLLAPGEAHHDGRRSAVSGQEGWQWAGKWVGETGARCLCGSPVVLSSRSDEMPESYEAIISTSSQDGAAWILQFCRPRLSGR